MRPLLACLIVLSCDPLSLTRLLEGQIADLAEMAEAHSFPRSRSAITIRDR